MCVALPSGMNVESTATPLICAAQRVDLLRSVEDDVRRRRAEAGLGRVHGVARSAPRLDDDRLAWVNETVAPPEVAGAAECGRSQTAIAAIAAAAPTGIHQSVSPAWRRLK